MGLITGLLRLPLAPARSALPIAERVMKAAEREYYDPAVIRGELQEVDRLRRTGELDEDEAVAREDALVERLLEGQHRGDTQ